MVKLRRKKVARAYYERQIEKNQKRIAKLSEENYLLRKQIAAIDAMTPQKPLTKEDLEARAKAEEAVADAADQEIGTPAVEA